MKTGPLRIERDSMNGWFPEFAWAIAIQTVVSNGFWGTPREFSDRCRALAQDIATKCEEASKHVA